MREFVDRIKKKIVPGKVIPRPNSAGLVVSNWSNTGECGVVYCAPSYSKKVTESELEKAYDQLMATGKLTRAWFMASIPGSKNKPCNFTAIGGIFELMDLAYYDRPGMYRKKQTGESSEERSL